MSSDAKKTTAITRGNIVLVVASSDELWETAKRAARAASFSDVTRAPIAKANTTAATLRPFALVVEDHLSEFAAGEMDALARDVGAVLIVCAASVSQKLLQASLEDAANRAKR